MRISNQNVKKIILGTGLFLVGVSLIINDRLREAIFPGVHVAIPRSLVVGILGVDILFGLVIIFLLVGRKPKVRILVDGFIGIGFALLLWASIETGFYYLNQRNERQLQDVNFEFIKGGEGRDVQFVGEHSQSFFRRDDWLGYKLVPDTQVIASRQKGEKTLYQVVYTTDARGRRLTPADNLDNRSNYILFFGGSYTFGEGVNDDETMPYYVSQLAPGFRVYNFGVGGYGPQHMLAKLQEKEMTTEVEEANGILIYTFINEHIIRAIGSMRIHSQRGEVMPHYYLDGDGELVRDRDMVSGRPLTGGLYAILGRSHVLRFFDFDYPFQLGGSNMQTTAKIIEEARNRFQEKFNSADFYVLIYPGRGFPELLPYLETADIKYLDYSELPEIYDDDFWLGEGHPSAKAHRIVAEKLVQDLGLLNGLEK
jgi:hypothetical protein